ncbi:MAG: helix-turn-helix domain-containing protein [Haloferacaceae archaeon]
MQMSKTAAVEAAPSLESPRAKLAYLYLADHGPATLDELHDRLGESRFALLGVLSTLEERGLVAAEEREYAVA